MPHKISHHSFKKVPIFNTFTHNPKVDSLNKHICCDLQRIARTYQTKKATTLSPCIYLYIYNMQNFCRYNMKIATRYKYIYIYIYISGGEKRRLSYV